MPQTEFVGIFRKSGGGKDAARIRETFPGHRTVDGALKTIAKLHFSIQLFIVYDQL